MDLVSAVIVAIWVMLPAYIPNNVAVLVGGGRPVDGGRTMGGSRLLGDGKTWRGTVGGIAAGIALALLLNALNGPLTNDIELPLFSWGIILAFPIGALLGDILASFVKRRTGRERGSAFPLVDQLDFVVVALIAGVLVDPGWMLSVFTPLVFAIVILVTPVLHLATNGIAYLVGLKNEPW